MQVSYAFRRCSADLPLELLASSNRFAAARHLASTCSGSIKETVQAARFAETYPVVGLSMCYMTLLSWALKADCSKVLLPLYFERDAKLFTLQLCEAHRVGWQ